MLDKLKEILEAMDSNLYYGQVAKAPENWNYTTFNRVTISKSGKSKMDFCEYYEVHIVRENYVPERYVYEVIKQVLAGTRLRLADKDIEFEYFLKGNTNLSVEVATITFALPVKGCEVYGE